MPSHRVHRLIDKAILGKTYPRIHRALDAPVKSLGKHHRIWYHDPLSAGEIAERLYPGDGDAFRAAQWHVFLDRVCSQRPSLRRSLERLAKSRSRKKKGSTKKKKNKKSPKEEAVSKLSEVLTRRILSG